MTCFWDVGGRQHSFSLLCHRGGRCLPAQEEEPTELMAGTEARQQGPLKPEAEVPRRAYNRTRGSHRDTLKRETGGRASARRRWAFMRSHFDVARGVRIPLKSQEDLEPVGARPTTAAGHGVGRGTAQHRQHPWSGSSSSMDSSNGTSFPGRSLISW